MKKHIKNLLLAFLFTSINICMFGNNLSDNQHKTAEAQIDSIFSAMLKLAEKLDYDKLAQGVDDKYNAGFIANEQYFDQIGTLIDFMRARSQGIVKQSFTIEEKKISILSENIAIVTAKGNAWVEINTGNTFAVKILWSFVYEKIDNEWKVVHSHQSSVR